MKKAIIGLLIMTWFIASIQGQSIRNTVAQANGWLAYIGSHKLNARWGLHLETQLRGHEIIADWQQILLRPGINFQFNGNAFATAGYCFVLTWPYGELPAKSRFPEHRWWEQIQVKSQLGSIEWVNRLRLEQRFVQNPVAQTNGSFAPGDAVYSNRFRAMNRLSVPFKGGKIMEKSLYFSVFDEIMVSFGQNVKFNIFDQNRAYAAVGYVIPKLGRMEIGYLNQLIIKGDGVAVEQNHTACLSLLANFPIFKKS